MVPIGELSAVDTAFLELVPSPLAEVADASPVTVASGSEPVCPPLPSVPSAPGVPVGVLILTVYLIAFSIAASWFIYKKKNL